MSDSPPIRSTLDPAVILVAGWPGDGAGNRLRRGPHARRGFGIGQASAVSHAVWFDCGITIDHFQRNTLLRSHVFGQVGKERVG